MLTATWPKRKKCYLLRGILGELAEKWDSWVLKILKNLLMLPYLRYCNTCFEVLRQRGDRDRTSLSLQSANNRFTGPSYRPNQLQEIRVSDYFGIPKHWITPFRPAVKFFDRSRIPNCRIWGSTVYSNNSNLQGPYPQDRLAFSRTTWGHAETFSQSATIFFAQCSKHIAKSQNSTP